LGDRSITQIRVEHRSLLRVGGTEFEARHYPFQERWGSFRRVSLKTPNLAFSRRAKPGRSATLC
jgi:hypothetical protein